MADYLVLDDQKAIVSNGWTLRFLLVDDRWTHVCAGPSGDSLFRSIEGGEDPSRVLSPAYQEVEVLDLGGVARALGVGRSGPHHFSTAFSVESNEDAVVIEADLADRCRSPMEALACTYLVDADSSGLVEADSESAVWTSRRGATFSIRALDGAALSLAEAGRRATRVQILARIQPNTHTQRCRYAWRIQPGADRSTTNRP